MFDIWSFLLQTLTASGVAVLLIIIKALFKDKLPPKWHFAVWAILGIMILVPAGVISRYTLINWQFVVELIKSMVGENNFSQFLFPIPIITSFPNTVAEWVFAVYVLGIAVHIIRYAVSYVRLRIALSKGYRASAEIVEKAKNVASQIKIKPCNIIAVPGLPSAFVCGIIRPVLAVPANEEIDEKIILHELLHVKSRDSFWSVVICALRCLHWCNPLLVYCAGCATNDMENRCDQCVLEMLKGEERREYGRILLSMVNERFAKTPGTTCVNNGGKHIKDRIETIARFKKYPVGMGLVSICALIVLTISLVVGAQSSTSFKQYDFSNLLSFASARSVYCTTPAGAFDTYGKAVLDRNIYYRTMCAPYDMQDELRNSVIGREGKVTFSEWKDELPSKLNSNKGYYIYNLQQVKKNRYEGMIVFQQKKLADTKNKKSNEMYLTVQNLRVKKEHGRWVVIPLDDFQSVKVPKQSINWGCKKLPSVSYTDGMDSFNEEYNFLVELKVQTVCTIDNLIQNENVDDPFGEVTSSYDMVPKPNANFTGAINTRRIELLCFESQKKRDLIKKIGFSVAPVYSEDSEEKLPITLRGGNGGGSCSTGESWASLETKPGWGPGFKLDLGGESFYVEQEEGLPECFVGDLYINGELANQMELYNHGVAE